MHAMILSSFKSLHFQKIHTGKMVACKMESIIFRRHAVEWGISTPSSVKIMSHDIYEHKIKIGEIKTKMCRLKILDCLSQWGL